MNARIGYPHWLLGGDEIRVIDNPGPPRKEPPSCKGLFMGVETWKHLKTTSNEKPKNGELTGIIPSFTGFDIYVSPYCDEGVIVPIEPNEAMRELIDEFNRKMEDENDQ